MPSYRLYFINKHDHIERALDVDAVDDEGAVDEARAQGVPVIEVWERGRRVARLDGHASAEGLATP